MMTEAVMPTNSNVIQMAPTQTGQTRSLLDMDGCTFTSTSLIIEPGLPFDAWIDLGKRLAKADDSLGIWRGDWINYGKHEYGKKYEAAVALTGLKKNTLANDVWVAKAIDPSLRSEKLTTRHYKELAPLKAKNKIRKWIERALKGDKGKAWTASRLKREINNTPTAASRTEEDQNYLDPHYKRLLLNYIASQNSFLNDCNYEPFKREIERTIKRAKYQLGRTDGSDFEAVLKQIREGAATLEEIAEEVPLSEAEIDKFCVRAVGCPRPRKESDQRKAGTDYEWRPINVHTDSGKGMRTYGVFHKTAPSGDQFSSGYSPRKEYGDEEEHY